MEFDIEKGDHCERDPWTYSRPYQHNLYGYKENEAPPCPHAVWLGDATACTRADGSIYAYERKYEIPEAATLLNEAGHNCTILCLLCADDARRANSVGTVP